MLRTKVSPQPSLFESMLGDEFRRLPPGLSGVDAFLDDPAFFEPFVPYFDPRFGRPSIPIETYLRLMHLRFRYRLGFETLCAEVTDSLGWRRFCRIGPYDKVPDPSTLMKITKRCGSDVVTQERGAAQEGRCRGSRETGQGAGRHDRRAGQCRLPDRLGPFGQGRRQARPHGLVLEADGLRRSDLLS